MPADGIDIELEYTGHNLEMAFAPSFSIRRSRKAKSRRYIKILYRSNKQDNYITLHDDDENDKTRIGRRRVSIRQSMKSAKVSIDPIKELNYSWFSIQRREDISSDDWEEEFSQRSKNPLDKRIQEVSLTTSEYFFNMDQSFKNLMTKFQKDYFTIMTRFYGSDELDDMELDLATFSKTMGKILTELEIYSEDMEINIAKLVDVLSSPDIANRPPDQMDKALAMSTVKRMKEIISKWNETQIRIEDSYKPKTDFIKVMDAFLNGKTILFQANNYPMFKIKDQEHNSSVLSSGEKQLLIFMMAALNQKQSTHIFIADEPELSLHVVWQKMLVEKIMRINPAAQVIFATHSPDIVGVNSGNIVDLSVR